MNPKESDGGSKVLRSLQKRNDIILFSLYPRRLPLPPWIREERGERGMMGKGDKEEMWGEVTWKRVQRDGRNQRRRG